MNASPLSPLEPVPLPAVRLDDDFLGPRIDTLRRVTLPHQHDQLVSSGRIDNLAIAGGLKQGSFQGRRYNDSDVYKWIEAAAWSLVHKPDKELRRNLDDVVRAVAAAQEEDGYLNSYFALVEPTRKWRGLGMMHELYCAGHLIEAAVAHHVSTGTRELLDVAVRLADHIDRQFGADDSDGFPGHQEIELALVALSRTVDEPRYLRLAGQFLDRRGQKPSRFERELADPETPGNLDDYRMLFCKGREYDGAYAQDHLPVREQHDAVGHSVRAMYQYCAMADVAAETGDAGLLAALDQLWQSTTRRRMFVTAGIGSSRANEGFTRDFDLPEEDAYAETCAAIGLVLFSHRMMLLHADASYANVTERALLNGVLAGISLDGTRYFYENPLASFGEHQRKEWYECACCPPNLSRLFLSLGRFAYARRGSDLFVPLYLGGDATVALEGAGDVRIRQRSQLPWQGKVELELTPTRAGEFGVHLRWPEWSRSVELTIDGEAVQTPEPQRGWIELRRVWGPGSTVRVEFQLEPERLRADPRVRTLAGRVALRRGPLVYAFEETDHEAPPHSLTLPANAPLTTGPGPGTLKGVTSIHADGRRLEEPAGGGALYGTSAPHSTATPLTAVPYNAWNNRTPGGMAVWIRES